MRKMGGGKQMKLGILCTMINGFGRRGYYNSQEIGLGRALARKGHEVMIYKGIDPSEKEASETSRSSCLMYTDGAGAAAFPLWPMWEPPTAWTPILKAR